MNLYYQPYLKQNSRTLRSNQTDEEQTLWFHLRKRNILNYQFYRQRPIGKYIADFVCLKIKLIIEVDGSDHDYRYEEDVTRQKELESLGFYVFRVRNGQIRKNLQGVVEAITQVAQSLAKGELPASFDS